MARNDGPQLPRVALKFGESDVKTCPQAGADIAWAAREITNPLAEFEEQLFFNILQPSAQVRVHPGKIPT